MRHITDGELHAYLDGALDLLPDHRGDEVRDHLSHCPVCRERLQDEETIRADAVGIMGAPALEGLALPSFEELRERAEATGGGQKAASGGETQAPPRYRGPLKGLPLAWAATIVLALGVGWMGGGLWRSLPQGPGAMDSFAAEERSASEAEVLDRIPIVEPPPSQAQLAEISVSANRVAALADPQAPPSTPETDEARARMMRDVAGVRAAIPPVQEAERTGPPTEAPMEALRLAAPMVESVEELMGETLGDPRSLMESSDLAVPGLKVLSVEWEEWVPGERALHIRQLLSMGDTLELRYLGMLIGADPEPTAGAAPRTEQVEGAHSRPLSPVGLAASLPAGWNQVEVRWGRGWLVARAPLPEETLRSLLRLLR